MARPPQIAGGMIALVLGLGVVVLGGFLLLGGDSEPGDEPPATAAIGTLSESATSSTPATTRAVDLAVGPISATDVTCSSELPAFPCRALIDGDPATAWNVPGAGVGAEIRVLFDTPTRVTAVLFHNLDDDERLLRNARIESVEVHVGGSGAIVADELESGHGPYRVRIPPDPTESLVIHIRSSYPGEHYAGLEPFDELALQELTFTGVTDP